MVLDSTDGLWQNSGIIFIPKDDEELNLKLLVTSHSGCIGNRGADATKSILLENFCWENMGPETDKFAQNFSNVS